MLRSSPFTVLAAPAPAPAVAIDPTATAAMVTADQVLAMAAVLQCDSLVQRMARSGAVDENALSRMVGTALRFDVSSPAELYGGAAELRAGLDLIRALASGRPGAEQIEALRMCVAALRLQARLRTRTDTEAALGARLSPLTRKPVPVPFPDDVYFAFNDAYTETISQLKPRIIVNGSEGYLQSALLVAKVRSALLASIRAAYLWHELGGRRWHLFLYRRAYGEQAIRLSRA